MFIKELGENVPEEFLNKIKEYVDGIEGPVLEYMEFGCCKRILNMDDITFSVGYDYRNKKFVKPDIKNRQFSSKDKFDIFFGISIPCEYESEEFFFSLLPNTKPKTTIQSNDIQNIYNETIVSYTIKSNDMKLPFDSNEKVKEFIDFELLALNIQPASRLPTKTIPVHFNVYIGNLRVGNIFVDFLVLKTNQKPKILLKSDKDGIFTFRLVTDDSNVKLSQVNVPNEVYQMFKSLNFPDTSILSNTNIRRRMLKYAGGK